MKIGVLTLPFNNNYGGFLQAYALMTVLKRMGHEPTLIYRRHNKNNKSVFFVLRYFVKGILNSVRYKCRKPLLWNFESDYLFYGKNMQMFVNKYIQPHTKYIYSTEELQYECKGKFDAYIVGSDQVWRAIYVPNIENYFFDFTEKWNVIRISYAASFGTKFPEYTENQKRKCSLLLQNFDAVSVREKSGIPIIKSIGCKKKIEVVLDPTMLLSSQDYLSLIKQSNNFTKNKMFCYVLDNNPIVSDIIKLISDELNIETYKMSNIQSSKISLPSIEEWLCNIINADFVITDSFHGTVFSIIFNKPFAVIVNKKRGADRFVSLLDDLKLSDRLINDNKEALALVHKKINWKEVRELWGIHRMESLSYLKNSLESIN